MASGATCSLLAPGGEGGREPDWLLLEAPTASEATPWRGQAEREQLVNLLDKRLKLGAGSKPRFTPLVCSRASFSRSGAGVAFPAGRDHSPHLPFQKSSLIVGQRRVVFLGSLKSACATRNFLITRHSLLESFINIFLPYPATTLLGRRLSSNTVLLRIFFILEKICSC